MDNRKRVWAFIAYPDSVPEHWQSILANFHTPISISPLHDSDLNGDDTEKKPHWHVLYRNIPLLVQKFFYLKMIFTRIS